jgi:hypothetical protein
MTRNGLRAHVMCGSDELPQSTTAQVGMNELRRKAARAGLGQSPAWSRLQRRLNVDVR